MSAIVMRLCAALLLFPAGLFSQVFISEFHPVPAAGEPEWIELYNADSREALLQDIFLHDSRSVIRIPEIRIAAKNYALLVRDTNALRESRDIPHGVRLYELKTPSQNNVSDVIVLRDADSAVIDSVYYSINWGRKGISLERRDFDRPALNSSNIFASESPDSASAGYLNSVALLERDVRIKRFELNGNSRNFEITVQNYGRRAMAAGHIEMELNGEQTELLFSSAVQALDSADTVLIPVALASVKERFPATGNFRIGAKIAFPKDERGRNDSAALRFFSSYPFATVRFNELMYEAAEGGAKFIELWNSSDQAISLEGWAIRDRDIVQLLDGATIAARDFLVLAWDSLITEQYPAAAEKLFIGQKEPGLRKSGGELFLLDPNGLVQDSLFYSPDWHARSVANPKGTSLEKINRDFPSNSASSWTSSGAGASPGRENSVALDILPQGSLSATPNPFSPRDEGGKNFTIISYRIPFASSTIQAQIFSESGVLLRRLVNADYTSAEGNFQWDGRDAGNHELPAGPYILHLEAVSGDLRETFEEKILLVIGK